MPAGKWVAYTSNESGRTEIYVRPFTVPSTPAASGAAHLGRKQVSTNGGRLARWRADGRELYYLALDGAMMSVPIVADGATLEPGIPARLFQTRLADDTRQSPYDVAADGRFLINAILDDAVTPPITLIQNWQPGAKRYVSRPF